MTSMASLMILLFLAERGQKHEDTLPLYLWRNRWFRGLCIEPVLDAGNERRNDILNNSVFTYGIRIGADTAWGVSSKV